MSTLKATTFALLSATTLTSIPTAPQTTNPQPHPKYRNIIFDLGAVLVDWNPKKVVETLFHNRKSSPQGLPYELVQAAQSHLWHGYDRGTISEQELISLISNTYNVPYSDAALFVYYAPKALIPLELGLKIFTSAKKLGFKIFLLTNLSQAGFEELNKATTFFSQADGYVASFEINKIKPEPEIYETLLKKYNLNPTECLFIDDKPENIKGGEALGIDGIICDNHLNTIETLKQKGIIVE